VGRLAATLGLLLAVGQGICGEASFTEYQVKALFLFNFAKYVEWPAEAFASTTSPIVIGVVGDNKFGDQLKKAVDGKSIGGRPLLFRQIEKDDEMAGCHIVFVSASETKRLPDILERLKAKPVLTVSEIERFVEQGGVIGFVKRQDRIRLEIDLDAAQRARLQLSSKLLSVADTVRGKR